MRNTKDKLFRDKTLRHLHDDLNICGVVRNHFIALCRRYYRRYGKGLPYGKMSAHLTKLKKLEKYKHWNIPYSWALQNVLKRLSQSFREMKTLGRGHPQFKSCKKHKGMTFRGEQVKFEYLLPKQKNERNHPTYKIRLNGRWYRFALHRPIEGEIIQVQVTRDALGDVYITLTEECGEVKPEPKTGKAEGFDMGIKGDFMALTDTDIPLLCSTHKTLISWRKHKRHILAKVKGFITENVNARTLLVSIRRLQIKE